MRTQQYIDRLAVRLQDLYDKRESENIADYLLEELFGKPAVRLNVVLSDDQLQRLNALENRLMNAEPVQYVLGSTWFYGLRIAVNPSVLIPRPETEELVEHLISHYKNQKPAVLDLGTGSGCIAIALKKYMPGASLTALDISAPALATAKENAQHNHVEISFVEGDMANFGSLDLPEFELIVSNPPYVIPEEKKQLHPNVLNHEPAQALFTPEEDPLHYYVKVIALAADRLKKGGWLWFEVHSGRARDVMYLMEKAGFRHVSALRDLQKRERIVRGRKA